MNNEQTAGAALPAGGILVVSLYIAAQMLSDVASLPGIYPVKEPLTERRTQ